MGNYSSKLFSKDTSNDNKTNEHGHLPEETDVALEQVPQNGEKLENPSDNEIIQTPIKKNYTLESRKRTNAIPEYLQTEKTRKPYLETDLDCVSNIEKSCLDPRSPNIAYPRTPILLQNNLDPLRNNDDGENLSKLKLQTNAIDLDPRSPASDFDRTPISAVKISRNFNSQCQDVNRLRKSNSSLDICIKLSYCETTSLFNIPEIQALPDIVVSLRRSCSLKDNLNQNSSSTTVGDTNVKSELISDELPTIKLHVSSENDIPNPQEEYETVKPVDIKSDKTEINSTNVISENNIEPTKDLGNEKRAPDPEGKIKVWRDSYSKLPENSQKNLPLPAKEDILIEFDDYSLTNSMKSNQVKKIEKTEGTFKEKKIKAVDKRNVETTKENKLVDEKKLFSPEFQMTADFPKSRTPFSNRSNNNGQIQALSIKSPQQFLGHRKLFITENRNLQENTPPTHKKRVKNVPTKLNGTQWDSESTIII